MKELSQYDFGLTIVNSKCDNMAQELKYGFWNKCFDYLLAGIPQITLNDFETMSDFINKNKFGFSIKNINGLYKNHNLSKNKQKEFITSILSNREKWLMDKKIHKMHTFYINVIKSYHTQKIQELTK